MGLAKNFKKRWGKHKTTLRDRDADGQTTLSTYVWKKTDEGLDPTVDWRFLEKMYQISTQSQKYADCAQGRNIELS